MNMPASEKLRKLSLTAVAAVTILISVVQVTGIYADDSLEDPLTSPITSEVTPTPTPTPLPTPTIEPTPTPKPATEPARGGVSSESDKRTQECTNQDPAYAPQLFQINSFSEGVKVYFSPVLGNVNGYTIKYGVKSNDYIHSVTFDVADNWGVQAFQINELEPDTLYFFRVQARNGCAAGPFSNELFAITQALEDNDDTFGLIFTAWEQLLELAKSWLR